MLSWTFSRDGDDLVIDSDPNIEAGLHLTEKDCTWPAFTMRRTNAPASETVAGEQLIAAVANEGTLGLGVCAHGADTAAVEAAKAEFTAAATQFSYVLTLRVNGVTIGAYNAKPEFPNWGALDSGAVRAHINNGTITIPINPPAGA